MSDDWFARPVLHVADVQRTIDFYTARLGFTEAWRHEEDGKLLIVQLERNTCVLIFSCQWPEKIGKGLMFISLDDGDQKTIDTVRAELEKRGAPVKDGQWGYRLFVIDDPDGNQLFFNYPAEE
jgi:catechol 2,3-dioxygenase-like lactoylglutathione lyase family enzyme